MMLKNTYGLQTPIGNAIRSIGQAFFTEANRSDPLRDARMAESAARQRLAEDELRQRREMQRQQKRFSESIATLGQEQRDIPSRPPLFQQGPTAATTETYETLSPAQVQLRDNYAKVLPFMDLSKNDARDETIRLLAELGVGGGTEGSRQRAQFVASGGALTPNQAYTSQGLQDVAARQQRDAMGLIEARAAANARYGNPALREVYNPTTERYEFATPQQITAPGAQYQPTRAGPQAPRVPNFQNFVDRNSGQTFRVNVNDPEQVARLEAMPNAVRVGISSQGTSPEEAAGISTATQSRMEQMQMAAGTTRAMINEARGVLSDEVVGAVGGMRRLMQGLGEQAGAVQQWASRNNEAIQQDIVDSGATVDASQFVFDPRLPAVETVMNILAYRLARTNDPSGRVSDKDLENAKRSLGYDRLLTGAASINTSLDIFERLLDAQAAAARNLMGEPAPAVAAAPQAGAGTPATLPSTGQVVPEDLQSLSDDEIRQLLGSGQ